MPRYVIERTFPDGLRIPADEQGARLCQSIVEINSQDEVTWVHSYVSDDKRRSFCVYDAPGPEAIRRASERSGLPVDRITQITVLDPFFYRR
jgi:hypothetical protein